jgi:hypothetical protein
VKPGGKEDSGIKEKNQKTHATGAESRAACVFLMNIILPDFYDDYVVDYFLLMMIAD